MHSLDDDDVDPPVLERRRNLDRRKGDGVNLRRVKLSEGFSGGWLIFESERERRRLSPIPSDWENVPAEQLSALCSRATPPRGRPSRAD